MQKRFLFLLLAVWCLVPLSAQDTLQLSLSGAQDYALTHNRVLKNASLDVRIAEANKWKAMATMLPQVNATLDYSDMFGYKLDFGPTAISMPNSIDYGGMASVSLSGAQVVGVQLQKIVGEMANITLKKSEKEVSDQVKTLYYSALVMEETVKLLQKNMLNLEQLMVYTDRSVEVGVAEQTDADLLSVQLASMKTTVNSTERSLEMIYNSMRLQLGLDVETEILLTNSIEELMSANSDVSLLDDVFLLDNNFNYQLLEQNVFMAKKQVALEKWSYAPSITAFYQYTGREYIGSEGGLNFTPTNVFGLSLKVPIFSSGQRLKAVKGAQLSYQKELNTFEDTREALVIQHRQLSYNLKSATENFDAQRKNMVVIQRVFDNVSKKYEQGMASSLDVTNSGTELVTAQSSYVRSLLDVVTAQIELEMLLNINNQ